MARNDTCAWLVYQDGLCVRIQARSKKYELRETVPLQAEWRKP
jgi:hypothetical protein